MQAELLIFSLNIFFFEWNIFIKYVGILFAVVYKKTFDKKNIRSKIYFAYEIYLYETFL